LTLNSINDAVSAWSERAPEIGEIINKTISGLPDAIAPVTTVITDATKNVIDAATKIIKGATGGTAAESGAKDGVQAVPIKVEKK
jgi:hypothetical protein